MILPVSSSLGLATSPPAPLVASTVVAGAGGGCPLAGELLGVVSLSLLSRAAISLSVGSFEGERILPKLVAADGDDEDAVNVI